MTTTPRPGPRTSEILSQLSIEEKAALTAGSGFFTMPGVERLGVGGWMTTDGPNGARGSSFLGSGDSKATCVPCGSALGATWNPELVEEIGVLLGREARTKAARVLLAPTVNLHRSPLAGRNFECFSEDPLLSGKLAAAYVRGVQSEGVITTPKHLVGNEAETDRHTSNSLIDDRALRELYLVPFELAVTEGGCLGIMTAYNRLNGAYCTEQRWLLTDLLRDEWGFEGFVTTDWMSGGDTVLSADAGLTIEMPSGDRIFGSVLAAAVLDGRVAEARLDELAGMQLSAFERIGAFDDAVAPEESIDLPEHRALARRAAVEAMVLLRNEPAGDGPVLPIDAEALGSIAVIGPNAARAQIMGGGSSNLRPFHRTTPLDAIRARLGDAVDILHAEGCNIDERPPLLSGAAITTPNGEQGVLVEVYDNLTLSGDPVGTANRDTSRLLFGNEVLPGLTFERFSVRASIRFTPEVNGDHSFALSQISPTRVLVDGVEVADGITGTVIPGTAFFGSGSDVPPATVSLEAGRAHEIVVEIVCDGMVMFGGAELRVRAPVPADALSRAVAVAAAADVAVVVVGTNDDWETEGEDRTTLALPGEQDDLIRAVVAANPRTVVVVNTGAPVLMPWAQEVPAILQTWLGGQEMADALVDVLTGAEDPGGRLPTTFPTRIEHTPSYGSFPGDNGQVPYAESIFVGYRWYRTRQLPVLWPFGHGLSYTTFEIGEPVLSASAIGVEDLAIGQEITLEVPVANTGTRTGTHVVQCYVRPQGSRLVRPPEELKAFVKVRLDPGEATTVTLKLGQRAFAYWDPAQPDWPTLLNAQAATLPRLQTQRRRTDPGWTVDPGDYEVIVAENVEQPITTVPLTVTA